MPPNSALLSLAIHVPGTTFTLPRCTECVPSLPSYSFLILVCPLGGFWNSAILRGSLLFGNSLTLYPTPAQSDRPTGKILREDFTESPVMCQNPAELCKRSYDAGTSFLLVITGEKLVITGEKQSRVKSRRGQKEDGAIPIGFLVLTRYTIDYPERFTIQSLFRLT